MVAPNFTRIPIMEEIADDEKFDNKTTYSRTSSRREISAYPKPLAWERENRCLQDCLSFLFDWDGLN